MKLISWLGNAFFITIIVGSYLLFQDVPFYPVILLILLLCFISLSVKWQAYQSRLFIDWIKQDAIAETITYHKLEPHWRNGADYVRRLLLRLNKKNEYNLEQINRLLDGIQISPNGVILLDSEKRIEWCNQQSCIYFGLDQQRDIKQHIVNLIRAPIFVEYLESQDYNESLQMSYGSSDRKIDIVIRPYGQKQLLILAVDITQIERTEKMRKNFVADVSHELRTPLTVLSGFIESMQTLPLTEDQKIRYLTLMYQQSLRMKNLVDDLLTLAKLEDSSLPSLEHWVSTAYIMEQTENMLREVSNGRHHIRFISEHEAELAGSESELISALSNIALNAVRYTQDGGHITIYTQLLIEGGLVFKVEDTGQGISQEHIELLTQRFYRVDRSRSRDTGGTGLGLSIVKHVLIRHGGYLNIESVEGKGSTFSLYYPKERVRHPNNLE